MKTGGAFQLNCVVVGLILLAAAGCDQCPPSGSLVLTKAPAETAVNTAADILDARFPIRSRVILREAPFEARRERILSGNLVAAGSPVVSYDGQRVFFVGKAAVASEWQIYETPLAGSGPRVVTSMSGGAMSPLLLPNGSLAFISPVSNVSATNASRHPSALFMQSPGGQPRQLTFSPSPITDATVLSDGRILFVAMQRSASNLPPEPVLYTINNDGTEITEFAERKTPMPLMERPYQLSDSRVAFVVSEAGFSSPGGDADFVRLARPCQNGSLLLSNVTARVRSVQSAGGDEYLVCAQGLPKDSTLPAVFRVNSTATTLGAPLVTDPKWAFLEAIEVAACPPPMGRLSTLDFTKHTGRILCLDVNFTRDDSETNQPAAARVRVTAEVSPGMVRLLGEVPVQADGSFLAEVPADVPLGFEVTDDSGRLLRQSPPSIWVRPGENRSCVGCHEPRHRAPHNHRPLAVNVPATCLSLENAKLAKAN